MNNFINAKYNHVSGKNKWINQQIRKRYNKIQYASKNYIYAKS